MSIIAAVGFIVVGVIVLAIDLVLAAFVVTALVLAFMAMATPAKKTTGEVIEVSTGRTVRGTRIRVSYYTTDGRHESETFFQRPRLGEQIPLWFNPRKPDRVRTVSTIRIWGPLAATIPFVVIFAALAAGMILSSVWYFTGSHDSLQAPVGGGSLLLTFAVLCGIGSVGQLIKVFRWRRMAQVTGTIQQRIDEPKPETDEVRGVLISFDTLEGEKEEFWAQSNISGKRGDPAIVYYDPGKPAESATVETVRERRGATLACTAFMVFFAAAAVLVIIG